MRITGGTYRGRRLQGLKGTDVRPTSEKVRQAIFNALAARGFPDEETVVLDCFCGTGALGIEALSRGAASCLFMDLHPQNCRANLEALGIDEDAHAERLDVTKLGKRPAKQAAAHLAFIDPPYNKDLQQRALKHLAAGDWLAKEALCVVETEKRDSIELPDGYALLSEKHYGDTSVWFVEANLHDTAKVKS